MIWRRQVDALERSGHATIALDLPGHGARSGERFSLTGALEAIDDAVRSCSEPPLLVGLSLGGYASLAYTREHAGQIAGVVLAGCSTEIKGKPVSAYRRIADLVARVRRPGGGSWRVVTDILTSLAGYSPAGRPAQHRRPRVAGQREP